MDVIKVLKTDHRKVDELFAQIEGLTSRAVKSKGRLFSQLKRELTIHASAEEQILYPRLKELQSLRHNAFEADEEHRLVKQLLAELEGLDVGEETWDAKMKVLKDMVQHHVEEEEGEIFKTLKAELDRDELAAMGEAIERAKETAERSETSDRSSTKRQDPRPAQAGRVPADAVPSA